MILSIEERVFISAQRLSARTVSDSLGQVSFEGYANLV
jgi:hypothetical protein